MFRTPKTLEGFERGASPVERSHYPAPSRFAETCGTMPNPAAVEDAAPRRLKQDMLCQQWRRAGAAPPDLRRLAAVLARGTSRADSRHAQPRSPKGQRLSTS